MLQPDNGLLPEDGDSSSPPLYWSVFHHKNVADTGPAASNTAAPAKSRLPTLWRRHEQEPLIRDPEVSYGLTTPTETQAKNNPGWKRLREMVETQELFIHHIPVNGNLSSSNDGSNSDIEEPNTNKSKKTLMKWSDRYDISYEFTIRECLFLTLFLLAIGVLVFSLLVEGWSILDSLYFTIVLLTTIGYGDMTPSTPAGKIFASFFALGGIVVLGLALGVVGSQLVEAEISAAEKMKEKTSQMLERAFIPKRADGLIASDSSTSLSSLDSSGLLTSHHVELLESILTIQQSEESYVKKMGRKCLSILSMIRKQLPGLLPILAGALIISTLEKWAWYDAFYYSVVTATTIGFGDLTPTSELTKFCAVIFIPFAVANMGYILGQCATFLVEQRREEHNKKLWTCDLKLEDLQALDEDHDGGVNELEYIKYMLIAMKKVDSNLFDELHDQFRQLDLNNDGVVTKKDLKLIAARKLRKVSYKLQLSDYKHKLFQQSRQKK
jgi:potassium channel subfamily K